MYHVQIIILALCLFIYILFQLYSILHAQYLKVLTHTCVTSSRDVGSGSQHPDHVLISSLADSVVSSHSPWTIVMGFSML